MWLDTGTKTEGELASDTINAERDYLIQESATPRLSCFAREAWCKFENKPKKCKAEYKAHYAAIQMQNAEIFFPSIKDNNPLPVSGSR